MAAGSLTLGGNMSLAVGPLGRNGEASGALSTSGKVAAMFVNHATLIFNAYLMSLQVQLLENARPFWWCFCRRLRDR